MIESIIQKYVGKTYEFEDEVAKIHIVQVKLREASYWVTYEIQWGGLPKRQVTSEKDFIGQFGHLFGVNND